MFSLETNFYGLSKKNWIIAICLLVMFFLFLKCKEGFTNSENEKSNLIKVYNFNTSWCGYSVRFQPEWDKFQKEVNTRDNLLNIHAYDIKCDNSDNKQMCDDYNVSGFPTIIIEKDNKKINYNGPRNTEAIIETIKNL
jgi:thiol-disulfide isomerase/thioredoxin